MSVGGSKQKQNQSGSYQGSTDNAGISQQGGITQSSGRTTIDPTGAWQTGSDNLLGMMGGNGLNAGQQGAFNAMQNWASSNPFQTSAGVINNMLMGDASQGAHQAAAGPDVASGNIAGMMGQFQNPYTQQVVDATTADANNALKTGLNEITAQYGGQYGNGRSGVATGKAVGDYTRGLAANIGNLRNQGFNTALGGATAQAGNDLSASSQNAALGQQRNFFNTQQQNIADQNRQGLLSQILGNVGATQDRTLQSQGAVFDAAGQGNNNWLNFMNSQVPAFGQSQTNEGATLGQGISLEQGNAQGTSQSSGGSSGKGGGIKLFS